MRHCASRLARILLLAAGTAAPAQEVTSRPIEVLATAEDGALLGVGPQRILMLRGDAFAMGRQHGQLLRDEVRSTIEGVLAWSARMGLDEAGLRRLRDLAWPHVPERYRAELRGLAEGSGLALERVELAHLMPSRFHCSGAIVMRTASRDGRTYHTRSLDYPLALGAEDRMQNHALLIVRAPTGGIATAVPAWAGFLGAVTGMNDAGISIGEMGSESRDEDHRGVPMIFQVRDALERARNLREAVDVFRHGPNTCGYHFLIASGDEDEGAVVEVTRTYFYVGYRNDPLEEQAPHTGLRDVLRRTNHFVAPPLAATQRDAYDPRRSNRSSWLRYEQITRFVTERQGRLDARTLIDLLRAYDPWHEVQHQAVLAPHERTLWLAQARDERVLPFAGAQNQDFVRHDLRALLAGTARTSLVLAPPGPRGGGAGTHLQNAGGIAISRLALRVGGPSGNGTVEVELFRPELPAPDQDPGTCLLVGAGDPGTRFSRVLALLLARSGLSTALLQPQDATRLGEVEQALAGVWTGQGGKDPVRTRHVRAGLLAGAGLAGDLHAQPGTAARLLLVAPAEGLEARLTGDADFPAWLGLDAARAARLADRLRVGHDAPRSAGRVLILALGGERRLPRADQERAHARLPGAEVLWLDASLRGLPERWPDVQERIRAFLLR
ncbi:MAG: hypothetical protein IT458_19650 [Planctomycetes bacterium]|nr:hypothetical protein [Planctomycetota bacterium]